MKMFSVGSLFAGIGGIDLAMVNAGFRIGWQVEIDGFCRKVLAKNFPDVPRYKDIYLCDDLPYVDVITAGFPCQPFSVAGLRKGADDDRFLIPRMLEVIDYVKPRMVLLENVPGFASLNDGAEFRALLGAVAQMGFDAQWGHLGAADIGAPHRRERWFCVLSKSSGFGRDNGGDHRERRQVLHDGNGNATESQSKREGWECGVGAISENVSHSERIGWKSGGIHRPQVIRGDGNRYSVSSIQVDGDTVRDESDAICGNGQGGELGDSECVRSERNGSGGEQKSHTRCGSCGVSARAGDGDQCVGELKPRLGGDIDGIPYRVDRHQFPAGRGVSQYDWEPDRTTTRKDLRRDRVKALGNAVVPQVVYPIALGIYDWLSGS